MESSHWRGSYSDVEGQGSPETIGVCRSVIRDGRAEEVQSAHRTGIGQIPCAGADGVRRGARGGLGGSIKDGPCAFTMIVRFGEPSP
jgi:hypothetical protein